MTNHIVGVAPAEPIPVVDHRAYCDVWAQDEDGLVLVSFLGPHTVLQALWAHLSAGHTVELAGGTLLHRQNLAAHAEETEAENAYKVRYFRTVVRFVEIGQAHLVMVAEPGTWQARMKQTREEADEDEFYRPGGDQRPPDAGGVRRPGPNGNEDGGIGTGGLTKGLRPVSGTGEICVSTKGERKWLSDTTM